MTIKTLHKIIGTARRPGMYRTQCARDVPREQGVYVYTAQERQERVTCPQCQGNGEVCA